jgi:hypothetical protein
MKIRMLKTACFADDTLAAERVYDVDLGRARELIARGAAVAVEPVIETATRNHGQAETAAQGRPNPLRAPRGSTRRTKGDVQIPTPPKVDPTPPPNQ